MAKGVALVGVDIDATPVAIHGNGVEWTLPVAREHSVG
jgi:hypothetical protein